MQIVSILPGMNKISYPALPAVSDPALVGAAATHTVFIAAVKLDPPCPYHAK